MKKSNIYIQYTCTIAVDLGFGIRKLTVQVLYIISFLLYKRQFISDLDRSDADTVSAQNTCANGNQLLY